MLVVTKRGTAGPKPSGPNASIVNGIPIGPIFANMAVGSTDRLLAFIKRVKGNMAKPENRAISAAANKK